jgi:hypothetical protein
MHRMLRFAIPIALSLLYLVAATTQASASLLRPNAGRAYPDIAGDINGSVTYSFNPVTQTGLFSVRNTPYLLAGGSTADQEYLVQANSDTGIRSQELKLTLDPTGQLVASSDNMYELWGTIVADGQTFSGLLLKGTPTGFGFHDLDALGISGADLFDVTIDINGGALASFFGSDAYMRIAPELTSTFHGRFDKDFSAVKATSNTRSYASPQPFPVPEPGSVAVLLLGVIGLAMRRLRLARH